MASSREPTINKLKLFVTNTTFYYQCKVWPQKILAKVPKPNYITKKFIYGLLDYYSLTLIISQSQLELQKLVDELLSHSNCQLR